MKRFSYIFALLTASCAVVQEPSLGVTATAPRTIQAQNTGTSIPSSVAAGSDSVFNGVRQPSIYQTKSVLDVRDFGVTCSGTTDDTTAMQAAATAACNVGGRGATVILPNSCVVKLTSTLNVTKCDGITIDGGQAQGHSTIAVGGGAGSGNAILEWYGAAGGTVLEINQTRDSVFKNFTVFTNASNYRAAGANIGILIDEIGTPTNSVTNNYYEGLQVANYSANSSFIGVSICPTAPGNCESQNFNRLTVTCAGATPTATSNGIGIRYVAPTGGGGAEPFYEYLHWYESSGCSQAIDVETTNILDIDGGLADSNYTDLFVNGGRNISYRHFRSENSKAQIVIGTAASSGAHDLTIEENSFSGLTNSTTTISYPFNGAGGIIRLIKNDWDANSTVKPFGPTGSGAFVGALDSQDNNYPNNTHCIATAFASSGVMYSSLNDQPTGGTCNYGGMHLGAPRASLRIDPTAFRNLPTCASGTQGMLKPVSDSTTKTWGATVTGGGSDHVLAYCDGTNWTVAAK